MQGRESSVYKVGKKDLGGRWGALQGEARGEGIIEIFQASGGSQKLK